MWLDSHSMSLSSMQISTNAAQIKVTAHSCATILLEATYVHVMMALHYMIMDIPAMVKGSTVATLLKN